MEQFIKQTTPIMNELNLDDLKRTKTRSFVTDERLLTASEEILKRQGSNVSNYCHEQLVKLVRQSQQSKKAGR